MVHTFMQKVKDAFAQVRKDINKQTVHITALENKIDQISENYSDQFEINKSEHRHVLDDTAKQVANLEIIQSQEKEERKKILSNVQELKKEMDRICTIIDKNELAKDKKDNENSEIIGSIEKDIATLGSNIGTLTKLYYEVKSRNDEIGKQNVQIQTHYRKINEEHKKIIHLQKSLQNSANQINLLEIKVKEIQHKINSNNVQLRQEIEATQKKNDYKEYVANINKEVKRQNSLAESQNEEIRAMQKLILATQQKVKSLEDNQSEIVKKSKQNELKNEQLESELRSSKKEFKKLQISAKKIDIADKDHQIKDKKDVDKKQNNNSNSDALQKMGQFFFNLIFEEVKVKKNKKNNNNKSSQKTNRGK